MLGSFRIGRVFGIDVRVHWLFPALVVLLIYLNARSSAAQPGLAAAETAISLAVLFGVVFLHELGHCLVARRYGIRVVDITLWPLGGMARMSEIPEQPRVEAWIAVAGPAVNFALAALSELAGWALAASLGAGSAGVDTAAAIARSFTVMNLLLGLFNLIPAFPMDGGRVLRALLARRRDWLAATEVAVHVGRIIAVVMIVVGLLHSQRGFLFLPVVGLFVWWSGARELWAVRLRRAQGAFFEGSRWKGAPAGAAAEAAATETGGAPPSRRLTDQDIERLERFQGRLRDFPG